MCTVGDEQNGQRFGKFNNRSSHDRFLRAFEVYLAAVQEKKQCP